MKFLDVIAPQVDEGISSEVWWGIGIGGAILVIAVVVICIVLSKKKEEK